MIAQAFAACWSALPPKADIRQRIEHVCFVPQADMEEGRELLFYRGCRSHLTKSTPGHMPGFASAPSTPVL